MKKRSPEEKKINRFVGKLSKGERAIAIEYLKIPNTADCQPEATAYAMRYGKKGEKISECIERLRQELGCRYEELQPKLQKLLH